VLDLACGDAAAMVGALKGTGVAQLSRRRSGGTGARSGEAQPRCPRMRGRARAARLHRGYAQSPRAC
jgi:hypothetical protein